MPPSPSIGVGILYKKPLQQTGADTFLIIEGGTGFAKEVSGAEIRESARVLGFTGMGGLLKAHSNRIRDEVDAVFWDIVHPCLDNGYECNDSIPIIVMMKVAEAPKLEWNSIHPPPLSPTGLFSLGIILNNAYSARC